MQCLETRQCARKQRYPVHYCVIRGKFIYLSITCLPNKLDVDSSVHLGPGIPIILIEGVLNGHNRVLLDELLVDTEQLVGGQLQQEPETTSSHFTEEAIFFYGEQYFHVFRQFIPLNGRA